MWQQLASGSHVETTQNASETEPASSAKLSLEISQLVSRALAGEMIDMPAEGERLAGRFPDLGMSGEMIGNAIARAISMVGAIRSGADQPREPTADAAQSSDRSSANAPAELADLIGAMDDPILLHREPAPGFAEPHDRPENQAVMTPSSSGVVARVSKSSVAAVRRALFGA